MSRVRSKRGFVVVAAGLFVCVPWTIASCATTEEGAPIPLPHQAIPEAGPIDSGTSFDADAAPDHTCDASDPECVTTPISCSEAAWCPIATGVSALYALTGIWGSSKDDVWAVGSGGSIFHWDGATWTPTPPSTPLKNTFRAIWGSGPKDVWVASATDLILHSDGFENGTASWELAPRATADDWNTAPIYAGWGSGPGAARFGSRAFMRTDSEGNSGAGNQIVATTQGDGSVGWSLEPGSATVKGIWGSSADDVWLVGDNSDSVSWQLGYTKHGVRRGDELVWTEVDSQASVVLQAIWGSSAGDVWAVGDTGTIRHIGAGGTRWEIVSSPTREALHAVWGAAPNDVWAVGDSGTILHWDGASWTPSVAAFPMNRKRPHLYGVWGSGPNDVWIVGDGIALRFTGGAK